MLPPGHVAAGYLAAYSFVKIVKPALEPSQINQLILWSTFFSFAPDLDWFWAFAREKAFIVKDFKQNDHRKFYSHAPLPWLATGLLIYFLSSNEFVKYFGLMLWLGSWTHFVLDSIEYGIMWLWPFSSKVYALKDAGLALEANEEKRFFAYWWHSVRLYTKSVSFYLEVVIVIFALIIYLK
jgi:hypothetical protein